MMLPYASWRYYNDQRRAASNQAVHHTTNKNNLLRQTEKAVMLKTGDEVVWLPLSRIVVTENDDDVTITLPLWLAKRKGLDYTRQKG